MKEKVILLFKIPSDHLEICNPVIYDVREIFFDEPNKNEKARKKLITSNVSHVQNTMSKISTIVNICYKKNAKIFLRPHLFTSASFFTNASLLL